MSQTSESELVIKRWAAAVDVDHLVDQIIHSMPRFVPSHRRMSEDVRTGQIEPIVRHMLTASLASVTTGADLSAETLERMTATARQRGAEGEPLEDILRAYRVGARQAWRSLRKMAGPDDGAALVLAAERLMALQDIVTLTVTRAYLSESSSLVSELERSARHLFEVLDERTDRWTDDAAVARTYGLTLDGPFRPFALSLLDELGPGHGLAAHELRGAGVLALSEGDRIVGLLAPCSGARDVPGLPVAHAIAIGDPIEPGRVEPALAILRGAVAVARRDQRHGVVTVADVAPDLLLELSPAVADALADSIFAPLTEELARTLEVLMEHDFDRRAAADILHVHRNTIIYRLRQITTTTGRDPGCPADLVAITLAYRARRAQRERLDGGR